jgi:hypothetical protein
MLETGLTDRTSSADRLGDLSFFVGYGIEDLGVETTAGAVLAP